MWLLMQLAQACTHNICYRLDALLLEQLVQINQVLFVAILGVQVVKLRRQVALQKRTHVRGGHHLASCQHQRQLNMKLE